YGSSETSESRYDGKTFENKLNQQGYHFHIEIIDESKINIQGSQSTSKIKCPASLKDVPLRTSSGDFDYSSLFSSPPSSLEETHTPTVIRVAEIEGLNSDLIKAIVRTESTWNPQALNSGSGARGLMQVTPITFKDVKERGTGLCSGINQDDSLSKLFDPETNVKYGSCYLKILNSKNGFTDTELLLAAYNWGPQNVRDNCNFDFASCKNVPEETKNYLDKVFEAYKEYTSCA
ncbi:hypothetical protein COU53_02100, partial [Candidatus Pacearchaeota archaeon CG10_big_fil_rev_8_21_14_0_10_30_48]